MARNGTGTMVLPAGQPVVGGTTILASVHNAFAGDVANELTNSVARDGQSPMMADLPMGGFKVRNLAPATVPTDAVNLSQITAIIGDSGSVSSRKRIRNSNFQINQRNVSGTVTLAAGAYGHDGWKAGASGCTYTFAASGNDTIVTISSGSLVQVVEAGDIEGGSYVLSQSGTSQMRGAVSGATPSGTYFNSPLVLPGATSGQSVSVEFTVGTVTRVQLEPGTVPTAYARYSLQQELAWCQRYFEFQLLTFNAYAQSGSGAQFSIPYAVQKRANPTITLANGSLSNGTDAADSSTTGIFSFRYILIPTSGPAFVSVQSRQVSISAEL